MTREEIHEYLCDKDIRNPNNVLSCFKYMGDEPPPRGDDCCCDNCYYGRDILALELLRLLDELEKNV